MNKAEQLSFGNMPYYRSAIDEVKALQCAISLTKEEQKLYNYIQTLDPSIIVGYVKEWIELSETKERKRKNRLVYKAKLNNDKTIIREIFVSNKPINSIAEQFNISRAMVYAIKRGDQHRNLTCGLGLGVNNSQSKLTDRQVITIKKSPLRVSEIAQKHHISTSAVYKIKNGDTWTHVNAEVVKPSSKCPNRKKRAPMTYKKRRKTNDQEA